MGTSTVDDAEEVVIDIVEGIVAWLSSVVVIPVGTVIVVVVVEMPLGDALIGGCDVEVV